MTSISRAAGIAAILLSAGLAQAQSAGSVTQGSPTSSLTFSNDLINALNTGAPVTTGTTAPVVIGGGTPSGSSVTLTNLSMDLTNGLLYGTVVGGAPVVLNSGLTTTGIQNLLLVDPTFVPPTSGNLTPLTDLSLTFDPTLLAALCRPPLPAIPEPGTWALMALGLSALAWRSRRT